MKRTLGTVLAVILAAALMIIPLAACSKNEPVPENDAPAEQPEQPEEEQQPEVDPIAVRIGSLTGPTSIGLVDMMDKAQNNEYYNDFQFTVAGTADEIVPKIIQGELDIALVPANVASVLWNRTEGGVLAIDINTLGVLYVVTGDGSIASFADLAGRTVYMTGKGTTPEYVMNYLLDSYGLSGQVTLEYKSEAAEVLSALVADPNAVGVLPQPFVTAATTKNPDLKVALSLTDAWDEVTGGESRLVTGVTIVRSEYLREHGDAVIEFLEAHEASVAAVNADPAAAAPLVVAAGIIDAEPIAQKAIPNCNLVCIRGREMYEALAGYLKVLEAQNPESVGGSLPSDNFYFLG